MKNKRHLVLLSKEYPTITAASVEIINLRAIMSLPKGTEYFFSDLHGEHEAFIHMLKSASGVIRTKIDDIFEKAISTKERAALASLIYKPEKELKIIKKSVQSKQDYNDFCKITIHRILEVCKAVSSKYTRSKLRKKMPNSFSYIIDELLHSGDSENRSHYYNEIINSIVETNMAETFIIQLCNSIDSLSIDTLHIIGDIYDRGPRADSIMNELMNLHNVDIQWGNHDISWMGAAAGNWACIANVIRLGISYNNFDLLEDGYGINLRPLSVFALQVYKDDPCEVFIPHILDQNKYDPIDINLAAKMHKAITIIQLKLEGKLIKEHPEYDMDDRIMLEKIDFEKGILDYQGIEYELKDKLFPTIDPKNPLLLTDSERELIKTIEYSFSHSDLLQKHIKFLYSHGSMYKCANYNLLYHGCVPTKSNGELDSITLDGKEYSGKKYFDYIDSVVRSAYFSPSGSVKKHTSRDFLWYLWCGKKSPLFGKDKMTTFERYFIDKEESRKNNTDLFKEEMNQYYNFIESKKYCEKIITEFGLDITRSHIINGHVPVKIKDGESPIKGGGLLYVIDGGMSKAYHKKTGIGGYTLIFNSKGLELAEHKPYVFREGELTNTDEESSPNVKIVELITERITVASTD
ncbi:MAG: fructose-1,6-bisphosphatase, partial [Clostridia bacterium]